MAAMESAWKRAKRALGLSFCAHPPHRSTFDDFGDSFSDVRLSDASLSAASSDSGYRALIPTTPTPTSSGLRISKSKAPTSKRTCTICLGPMKPGRGQALFTAECSHEFHFQCISSNVKHGNYICPICRSNWKEIPLHKTIPSLHFNPPKSTVRGPHPDDLMTMVRRVDSLNIRPCRSPSTEPGLFNDDDAIEKHLPATTKELQFSSERKSVEIKTYTEFTALPQYASLDDFSILVHIRAPRASSNPRAPVDLVTILDISGSMAGTKLALLKRAMGFVIQNLGPLDRLSVIAFSSTARRLFHLRRMSDSGRQLALTAVNSLMAGGGTNIVEGLKMGSKVIEDRKYKNPVSSIILLSDGQDTYNVSPNTKGVRIDYKTLLPTRYLPVHAFGFGGDHDSAALHSIAEASGGTFSFIEDEGVIQDAFAQCIGGLLSVVVQRMRVSVECVHAGVSLCSVKSGSYANLLAGDGRSGSIEAGDLYADEERDFLISVKVPRTSNEETVLVQVGCSYKDPVSKETVNLEPTKVSIQRPHNVVLEMVSIEVDRQRNRVRAAEAMALARATAEKGTLVEAVTTLEEERLRLAKSVSGQIGDRLCLSLDAELKEMQERMASRKRYEMSGRAYVLSGLSSHSWQRATARGDSTDSDSLVQSYQTPSMADMLHRSQTLALGPLRPPVRPVRSASERPQRK
ncbi:von Willebrand factor type A domain-containing protein [Carex littledalei]|uniref:von Willebrand factor type A domain-containing protein n=1 Tax=Carex littledalei TaxID=544730 RepID=A0A833VF18_9POAL|nr:von Willebrand factor type A domain-containing protein [Carex littledalei]